MDMAVAQESVGMREGPRGDAEECAKIAKVLLVMLLPIAEF
jgi:hypothetical protein